MADQLQVMRKSATSNWKRLTSTTGAQIDVNLDVVAYLYPSKEHTTVYFAVGDHNKLFSIGVKESLDGIHAAAAPSLVIAPAAPATDNHEPHDRGGSG